jgi:hypothetical protein
MTTQSLERDASLTAAYFGVAVSGAFVLSGAAVFAGARVAAGVAAGIVLALGNLWLIEQFVKTYLRAARGRFSVIAFFKAAGLVTLAAIVVKSGAVDVLPLVLGFGALPLGVVIGGAWPTRQER